MPVGLTSCVVLAIKKVTPEIENRELLENWVIARVGSLFSKLGINQNNASSFSIIDHDARSLSDYYGVDINDLIEDYIFVEGEVTLYDSSIWEGPEPKEEDLLEDSYIRFFHDKHDESDTSLKLDGDEVILIKSYLDGG